MTSLEFLAQLVTSCEILSEEMSDVLTQHVKVILPELQALAKDLQDAFREHRKISREKYVLAKRYEKLLACAITWKNQGHRSRWKSKESLELWDLVESLEKLT